MIQFCFFFKKGDKHCCSNYCGISLIDIVMKVFATILLKWFQNQWDLTHKAKSVPISLWLRMQWLDIQSVFGAWASLVFPVENTCLLHVFATAFDSVDHGALWGIMHTESLLLKLLILLKTYYLSIHSKVCIYDQESQFLVSTLAFDKAMCDHIPCPIDWITSHALASFPMSWWAEILPWWI